MHIGDLKNPVFRREKVKKVRKVKVRKVKVESEGKDRQNMGEKVERESKER